MRHWIPASVAAFGVFALCAVCVPLGNAQAGGAGQSGSVHNSGGSAPNTHVTFSGGGAGRNAGTGQGDGDHHHRSGGGGYPVGYVIGVPYAVELPSGDVSSDAQPNDDESDADYQGGPTIFDRRGQGADSYVPPVEDVPMPHSSPRGYADADETPQLATILAFKDGHDVEVGNYAIVGETLFDLTPGHARRVALGDLDLDGTRKLNEDRGVMFQLPASSQAN